MDEGSTRTDSGLFPPLFRELRDLAGNYWWSWQQDGPEVFRDISPSRWDEAGHNPRQLLDTSHSISSFGESEGHSLLMTDLASGEVLKLGGTYR